MPSCPVRNVLQQQASAAIEELIEVMQHQRNAFFSDDLARIEKLRHRIATLYEQKNRAPDDLYEHRKEHKC